MNIDELGEALELFMKERYAKAKNSETPDFLANAAMEQWAFASELGFVLKQSEALLNRKKREEKANV